jgi:hypothetical protein
MLLHGYVVPFGRRGMLGGPDRWTIFAPGAFEKFARCGGSFDVRYGSHAVDALRFADSTNGTAGVFIDDYGLAFWAWVDARDWRINYTMRAITRADRPANQCSGNFLIRKKMTASHYAGLPVDIITDAEIDHIAVVEHGVYGRGTGVWVADWVDQAAWQIRDLAAQWADGAQRWKEHRTAKAARDRLTKPGGASVRFTSAEALRLAEMLAGGPLGISPVRVQQMLQERRP